MSPADQTPPPFPAATVIVLRDAPAGPEVLLLRRDAGGAFGGMWVFPGGRVDPADADPEAPGDDLAAARRAAAREAAEEAGLALDPAALVPYAHWTPPANVPKRFATWFFVVESTGGDVVVDLAEVHEHDWVAATDALRRQAAGHLALAPPTWVTLHQLAAHATVADVLAAARRRTPERFTTRPLLVDGVAVLTWHGDIAYETGVDGPGPRHRLAMAETGWTYERTS